MNIPKLLEKRNIRNALDVWMAMMSVYRGAIGRDGTLLVRHGLAIRLGKSNWKMGHLGEKSIKLVKFELTEKGEQALKFHQNKRQKQWMKYMGL